MDRAGFGGQDDGVGLHLVGPALGVLAGGGGDRVDGAVGIHVHGRMGRQMALRVQDELVLGPQAQGDGGRLRAGIRHERLIGAGPLGIGETGLVSTQKAAGRAKEGGRQEGEEVFHRNLLFFRYVRVWIISTSFEPICGSSLPKIFIIWAKSKNLL